jgi:hypothetical protein
MAFEQPRGERGAAYLVRSSLPPNAPRSLARVPRAVCSRGSGGRSGRVPRCMVVPARASAAQRDDGSRRWSRPDSSLPTLQQVEASGDVLVEAGFHARVSTDLLAYANETACATRSEFFWNCPFFFIFFAFRIDRRPLVKNRPSTRRFTTHEFTSGAPVGPVLLRRGGGFTPLGRQAPADRRRMRCG